MVPTVKQRNDLTDRTNICSRTLPQPLLPGGFAHKLSKNYYFERDARRQVGQPQVLFSTSTANPMLASAVQPLVFLFSLNSSRDSIDFFSVNYLLEQQLQLQL